MSLLAQYLKDRNPKPRPSDEWQIAMVVGAVIALIVLAVSR